MRTIPCMDLSRQFMRHKEEFLKVIRLVCEQTAFSGGPFVAEFERQFAGRTRTQMASGVNNGTSALHLALLALGIKPGDEVLVPANTFIATAWAVAYVGAIPVFVDCTEDTWNMNPSSAQKAITQKTKAIMGVHLYGQPFDVDAIKTIAADNGLFLIEDCAQAYGASFKGQTIGGLGDIGCFSFYPSKNLGAFGEAGAVVSQNKEYIQHIQMLKNHGAHKPYYHEEIGYNMRMDGIHAAILSVKLKYIDAWTKRRQVIAGRYLSEIRNPNIVMPTIHKDAESVFHLFVVMAENKDKFLHYMEENSIICGQHYPVPCHIQKAFANLGYKTGDMPNAENLAEHCVSIPMFPELTDDEVTYVIETINKY